MLTKFEQMYKSLLDTLSDKGKIWERLIEFHTNEYLNRHYERCLMPVPFRCKYLYYYFTSRLDGILAVKFEFTIIKKIWLRLEFGYGYG